MLEIDMVNINSISFNSKCYILIANLETSSNQGRITIQYKITMGSDGNRMPLQVYKKLFPRKTKEQLMATRNKNIQLKTFNRTRIKLLGIGKVKIEHNNKQKM